MSHPPFPFGVRLSPVITKLSLVIIGISILFLMACGGTTETPPAETVSPEVQLFPSHPDTPFEAVQQRPAPGTPGQSLVHLPADEASHNTPIEWWYFNGFLTDDRGGEYYFHYVALQGEPTAFGVPHLVRLALATPDGLPQRRAEWLSFMPPEPDAPSVYLDQAGWVMRGDGAGNFTLAFNVDGIALNLSVAPAREPVMHYQGTGLTDFGADTWAYYYSYTRQNVVGHIQDAAGRRPVAGVSWYDHQWGRLENPDLGRDWFGMQLDDGSDLMLTRLWRPETGDHYLLYGTWVSPDGEAVHVANHEASLTLTRRWTSLDTGNTYPVAWIFRCEPLDLTLELKAIWKDSEVKTDVSYWEGAVRITGTRSGVPVSGTGFAELVGYDPRQVDKNRRLLQQYSLPSN